VFTECLFFIRLFCLEVKNDINFVRDAKVRWSYRQIWLSEPMETNPLVFKLKKMGNTTVLDPR
jgi:hypothetical protein